MSVFLVQHADEVVSKAHVPESYGPFVCSSLELASRQHLFGGKFAFREAGSLLFTT